MRLPVDRKAVTPHGAYAYQRTKRRHHGVDLGGARGTIVYAPEALVVLAVLRGGKVTSAPAVRGVGLDGYGPEAILAAGASGVVHVFGHLESVIAAPGDEIAEGAPLGTISKARHVHWEVRIADRKPWPRATRGADTLDPLAWLAAGATPAAAASTADWFTAAKQITQEVRAKMVKGVVSSYLWTIVLGYALTRSRSSE